MKKLSKVIVITLATGISFFLIDFVRVKMFKLRPIFAIKASIYRDGGSQEYYGLGYKVVRCNTTTGDKSTGFGFYNLKFACDNIILPSDNDFEIIEKNISCINNPEVLYVDNTYIYYLDCEKNDTIFVKFKDGQEYKLQEAIMQNLITMEELENRMKKEPDLNFTIIKYLIFNISVNEINTCVPDRKGFREISSTIKPLNYDLYYYCIDESSIEISNEHYDLLEALRSDKITIEKIIAYLDYGSRFAQVNKQIYGDDGSVLYNTLSFSILECNTFNESVDYYIGKKDMKYDDKLCKNKAP